MPDQLITMVSCRGCPTATHTCTHQEHVRETADVIIRGWSINGLLACTIVTLLTVNRRFACHMCWHYKHRRRRPQLCRYGCLCFDLTTVVNRSPSKANHYILQQLPTSHISPGKAGFESKRYLLKALAKTASLCNSILKSGLGLRRCAVGCPHSSHSFSRL